MPTGNRHSRLIEAFDSIITTPDQERSLCREDFEPNDATIQLVAALKARLGSDTEKLMIDYLTNPIEFQTEERVSSFSSAKNRQTRLSYVAAYYVSQNPSAYSANQLIARLDLMLENSFKPGEMQNAYDGRSPYYFAESYFFPQADQCLTLLIHHAQHHQSRDFLSKVFTGKYLLKQWIEEEECEVTNYEVMFSSYGDLKLWLEAVHESDQLTANLIDSVSVHFPNRLEQDLEGMNQNFVSAYQEHMQGLKARTIANLPARAETFQQLYCYDEYEGLKWLRSGLEQVRDQAIKPAVLKTDKPYPESVRQLLNISALEKTETKADALVLLAEFSQATLETALPYTGAAKEYVMQALGMQELSALDRFISKMHEDDEPYNCEDPTNGIIDLPKLRQITDLCAPKELAKFLTDAAKAHEAPKDVLVLVSAACGLNKDKIEKKLVKHGQIAIKAYGLYPVESAEELRARYTCFKKMHKEASQYGAERQANTRAAVTAGLANLSQSAGFTDATRMEWALEADLAENITPMNEWQTADEWEICLRLEGISPRIAVRKGEKALKSVPSKVRQQASYKAMRAAQDQIKTQASRFKSTLQTMMCLGELIEAEELNTLQRLPVVATMLSQLILQDEQFQLGMFDPHSGSLINMHGQTIEVSGKLKIAHTLHLFEANVLSDWQRFVVKQEIVQPFKQAFRELYIVTPAEIEAKNTSRRFDGQVVDSSIAGRLLQGRLWSLGNWEYPESERIFPKQNITASIEFRDVGHYFSENSEVTIGEIQFRSSDSLIDLAEVNPLVFSEVMRDADLVAGVAQVTEDDQRWSTELAQHRREIVTALIGALGMSNVSCKDNFAFVQGTLGDYRIHLGSGAIHIVPGNYLCIVPAGKKEESVYLPFSDTDSKMQEIISKVLLLSNDDKIKDDVILNQIRRPQREAEPA